MPLTLNVEDQPGPGSPSSDFSTALYADIQRAAGAFRVPLTFARSVILDNYGTHSILAQLWAGDNSVPVILRPHEMRALSSDVPFREAVLTDLNTTSVAGISGGSGGGTLELHYPDEHMLTAGWAVYVTSASWALTAMAAPQTRPHMTLVDSTGQVQGSGTGSNPLQVTLQDASGLVHYFTAAAPGGVTLYDRGSNAVGVDAAAPLYTMLRDTAGTVYGTAASPLYDRAQMLFNQPGASWEAQRTPTTFKVLNPTAIVPGTPAALWTPASGKKVRVLGLVLGSTVGTGEVLAVDGGSNNLAAAILAPGASVVIPFGGNGALSGVANNVLNIYVSVNMTVLASAWGCEE